MKSYTELSPQEVTAVRRYQSEGKTMEEIARLTGRHRKTIANVYAVFNLSKFKPGRPRKVKA